MKIPETLKIGGHIIRVVLERTDLETVEDAHADRNKNVLILDADLSQDQKESGLIHEAMHFMNSTLDHTLLDSLAEQMYQFLKDNDLLKD